MSVNIPVHIIRFEDLLPRPQETLTDLMRFLLCEKNLKGRVIEKYIELAV